MASSSSSSCSSRTWRYRVFVSFHGPDVRKTMLSHVRKQFSYMGISMFDDQRIERGQIIAPALTQAIRESRISIVALSRRYASSSWCLDELVEILKCKEDIGQIVMTIFYGVDPSDVRKQTGDFGKNFKKTCHRKTKEERRRWSQALNDVGNIAGEHFLNWDNESKMIAKIANDISDKLNTKNSKDFEDMVCIEAHLPKLQSLLQLDDKVGAMIVGICGPAGIGKTTIARALYSRLSSFFELTCFMEDIRGSYNGGLDEYGSKLCLQEKLLSKILNLNGIRIYHLRAIQERLCDQKVLVILDDVDDLKQLEALANEINWFGPGSRIIVTTEDEELLEQHGINNTYHVHFPSKEEAHKIFCRYTFKQSSAPEGFEKLTARVTNLCSNLPLGLRVMGSSLRRKRKNDWERILHRLENTLDRKIEGVLRVGYDNLHKDDQLLFLLIAFFFNYKDVDHVMAMFGDDSNSDVRFGLDNLKSKSLVQISTEGEIVMHKLLQQMGREVVQRQDPEKRQILIDADEICHFLKTDSVGSRKVMGISFDISTLPNDVYISLEAFKRSNSLRFLSICEKDGNGRVHIPRDMEFPPRLRLLHWAAYPEKCLPSTFNPEYLVELNLQFTMLNKLWEGTQPLGNLKKMVLLGSFNLKELPNLSNATNIEELNLHCCESLIEIPSSIGNLHKLKSLEMSFCTNLQVVPTRFNLASLQKVDSRGCWQWRKFPNISNNITELSIADTMLQDLVGSARLWPRLQTLNIYGSVDPLPFLTEFLAKRRRRTCADIEKIPDCIKDLHELKELLIYGCPKLASLPELPRSLKKLQVENCESLETLVSFPFESSIMYLCFANCFKLDQEARRVITQHKSDALLPGRNIPGEFHHRAIGNSLTIPSETGEFKLCVVISLMMKDVDLIFRGFRNGILVLKEIVRNIPEVRTEHLVIFHEKYPQKMESEMLVEFSTSSQDIHIIECGLQILTDQTNESISSQDL